MFPCFAIVSQRTEKLVSVVYIFACPVLIISWLLVGLCINILQKGFVILYVAVIV